MVAKRKSIVLVKNNILFDYQKRHARHLIHCLKNSNSALDASDTGTGKTYIALAIAKELNLFPIVITPKSVITSWEKVAKLFKIKCYVKNYEQFRIGNTPYLKKENDKFKWAIPSNCILIFDEVHRCKNRQTQNSKILIAAKNKKILCLSATIADNPLQMYALGLTLNIFQNFQGYWKWCYSRGVYKGWFGMEFKNNIENLQKIHNDIFPNKGNRISIKELGDQFPENLIMTECYNMGKDSNKIKSVYDTMFSELNKLKKAKQKDGSSILTEILRARQEIELLKIPTLVEITKDHVAEGASIAIFVNFEETVQALSKALKTKCLITGSIKNEEREKNINDFQSDKKRIIICNIRAGGIGISLHDLNGKYNRISLISPSYSAQDLIQALGRIHRAGAKSKCIQKIIFCANTIEEKMSKKVEKKIKNIHIINDGDLQ